MIHKISTAILIIFCYSHFIKAMDPRSKDVFSILGTVNFNSEYNSLESHPIIQNPNSLLKFNVKKIDKELLTLYLCATKNPSEIAHHLEIANKNTQSNFLYFPIIFILNAALKKPNGSGYSFNYNLRSLSLKQKF